MTWKAYEAAVMRSRIAESPIPTPDDIILDFLSNRPDGAKRVEIVHHVSAVTTVNRMDTGVHIDTVLSRLEKAGKIEHNKESQTWRIIK